MWATALHIHTDFSTLRVIELSCYWLKGKKRSSDKYFITGAGNLICPSQKANHQSLFNESGQEKLQFKTQIMPSMIGRSKDGKVILFVI